MIQFHFVPCSSGNRSGGWPWQKDGGKVLQGRQYHRAEVHCQANCRRTTRIHFVASWGQDAQLRYRTRRNQVLIKVLYFSSNWMCIEHWISKNCPQNSYLNFWNIFEKWDLFGWILNSVKDASYLEFYCSVKTDLLKDGAISRLFIAFASKRDSGNYTCSMRNAQASVVVHILDGKLSKYFNTTTKN